MQVVLKAWPRDQLLAFLKDFCNVCYPALPSMPHAASIHHMSPSFLRWALPKTTLCEAFTFRKRQLTNVIPSIVY
jgi:hypothetical protein